jgi:hypothetical protein
MHNSQNVTELYDLIIILNRITMIAHFCEYRRMRMTNNDVLQRVSITMPAELIAFADNQAETLQTSRSQVISMALAAAKESHDEGLAAEGYRFYSAEAAAFAHAAAEATAEAWESTLREQPKSGAGDDGSAW